MELRDIFMGDKPENVLKLEQITVFCIEKNHFWYGSDEYPQIEKENDEFITLSTYKDKERTEKIKSCVFYKDSIIAIDYNLEKNKG